MQDRNKFVTDHIDLDNAVHWGDYRVAAFYQNSTLQANNLIQEKDITLISQCSVDNLHYLINTAERWRGPIAMTSWPINVDMKIKKVSRPSKVRKMVY